MAAAKKKGNVPSKAEDNAVRTAQQKHWDAESEQAFDLLAPVMRELSAARRYPNYNLVDDVAPRLWADVLRELGRHREAVEAYELHFARKGIDADRSLKDLLAIVLEDLGEPDTVLARVERAVAARPTARSQDPELKLFAVLAHLKKRDFARARSTFAEVMGEHDAVSASAKEREQKYGRDGEPWQESRKKELVATRRQLVDFATREGLADQAREMMAEHPQLEDLGPVEAG